MPQASQPLRSPAHRAKQGDHHYYELVRTPATGHRSRPSRFSRSQASLSPRPIRGTGQFPGGSPPPFRARAADRTRATSTPGTPWPAVRAAARVIPGLVSQPGSDAVLVCFDASTVNTTPAGSSAFSATPSRSPPDTSRCLFPDRSPPRPHDQRSAGQLEAIPQMDDSEGPQNPHLPHSTTRDHSVTQATSCLRRTQIAKHFELMIFARASPCSPGGLAGYAGRAEELLEVRVESRAGGDAELVV
jgi:hypothetical protein